MPDESAERRMPSEGSGGEDIEILEVVGVDEDGEPIAPPDPDDVEVVFEEGDALTEEAAVPMTVPPAVEDDPLRERLLRLQADFENFKKRIDRERIDYLRYATGGLVGRILPVLDNFERAMASARPGPGDDGLMEGLALIQRQLLTELEAEGLRVMNSMGETFDPARHEAVATDSDSPVPAHTVTQVFLRGYFLHDRVLRPAMVRVRVDASEGGGLPDDRKES
jgi:molecular chaperone GrpE